MNFRLWRFSAVTHTALDFGMSETSRNAKPHAPSTRSGLVRYCKLVVAARRLQFRGVIDLVTELGR